MRDIKMLKLFVIILCLVGFFSASAQSDYIVLAHGDTLTGKVTLLDYAVEPKVQLLDANGKKKIYTILQLKAFQMDNESYHVVRKPDQYAFMKVLQSGYLSLYAFQMDGQHTWNGRYLLKRDGNGQEVPTIGFKRKIYEFLSECPEITEEIGEGNLGRKDLEEIINLYNTCIDQRTALSGLVQQQKINSAEKANTWNELEAKTKASDSLSDKETVLEMIAEARSKTEKGEKIPKFLYDGLKKSLEGNAELQNLLTEVLREIDQ